MDQMVSTELEGMFCWFENDGIFVLDEIWNYFSKLNGIYMTRVFVKVFLCIFG